MIQCTLSFSTCAQVAKHLHMQLFVYTYTVQKFIMQNSFWKFLTAIIMVDHMIVHDMHVVGQWGMLL